MVEGRTIFITGGAGFIGSTLAGRLVERNRVIIFDNMSRNSLKDRAFADAPNLRVVRGDVLDFDGLRKAMQGADIVVHCAAIAGVPTVSKSPVTTMRVNMIGSANVLAAAAELARCDRVVCFSTSEVFGSQAFNSEENDGAVTGTVGEARWTYAVSKLAEEHLAISYFNEKWLPTTVVRPFNIYGPGQVGEGAMRTFVLRALRNEPLEVHGDGTQIRAWCYVDDMIEAVLVAMGHPRAVGECFNIGNQRAVVTIYGLANTVVRVLQSRSPIVFARKEYADIELRIPSVRKAKEVLGFEAKVDLEEGILRTAEYYRTQLADGLQAAVLRSERTGCLGAPVDVGSSRAASR
ncbi:MAG TPA: NAD-dependent epimerase/dehydratase family protein [Planctomycetota bacterium]|nr:NAD-dependent epimerase/dehydratase family protein [Planctomycetota bacterium]HRR79122.1 NAD-dependent epimerase/dehydratase family protein [Planctomycetota bacterium]HRT95967.1 NAD-dependent epimerase/dehydratase family protein [Planctomycetota bacterium]